MTTETIRDLLEHRKIILEAVLKAAKFVPETDSEILDALCLKAQELKPDRIQSQSSEHVLDTIARKDREVIDERTLAWQIACEKEDVEKLDCLVYGLRPEWRIVLLLRYYDPCLSVKDTAIECHYVEDHVTRIVKMAIREIKERWDRW